MCPPPKHSRGWTLIGAIGGACLGFGFAWVTGVMTLNPIGFVAVPLGVALWRRLRIDEKA